MDKDMTQPDKSVNIFIHCILSVWICVYKLLKEIHSCSLYRTGASDMDTNKCMSSKRCRVRALAESVHERGIITKSRDLENMKWHPCQKMKKRKSKLGAILKIPTSNLLSIMPTSNYLLIKWRGKLLLKQETMMKEHLYIFIKLN